MDSSIGFTALTERESEEIGGGLGWMIIAAGTVLLVAKECITHYKEFEQGVREGYAAGNAWYAANR